MILTLTTIICDIAAERRRKAAAKQREAERADSAERKRKAAMKEREAAEQRRDAALADVATIARRLDELSTEVEQLRNERATRRSRRRRLRNNGQHDR